MKIVSVDVIKTTTGKPAVKNDPWNPLFVQVHTDEGITGVGEVGMCYGRCNNAGFGSAVDFAKVVLGMDPMKNEQIWDVMHRNTFWGMGGGGVVAAGMSAIDIALWDIKGKALGVPCYQLLGGKRNDAIRAYASQVQFYWGKTSKACVTPEDYAEVTRVAMADGYDAVKVDPIGFDTKGVWMGTNNRGLFDNRQLRIATERVAAMREAGGEDLDIIIELHSLTDATTAVQYARAVEPYRIYYYEEPTQPLNATLYQDISRQINIPVAGGERLYFRWGFRPFFEDRSIQIIQPDLTNTGGLTEGKKICDMAHVYDIGVQLHVCGGPVSTAAALQLEAAIPNFVIHEHHSAALLDSNINLCKYDYQPVNGYFQVPDLPGIGQELAEDAFRDAEIVTVK